MSEPVEGTAFRTVMRRVPSPVVVVTAQGEEEPRGITIGSFTSVALEPPLVSFNVGRESRMYGVMEHCSRYAVHVLSEQQASLATRFAEPGLTGQEQFDARFHCTPHSSVPAGDHILYVGLVVDVETPPDQGAVLYYQSSYRGVGSELPSTELSPVNRVSSDPSS